MKINYPFDKSPEGVDVLWRCEARQYSIVIDPEREEYGVTPPRLEMIWWKVDRRTKKGAWVAGKFVLLTARKRWACNTEEEALESFKARKRRQISILTAKLEGAKRELALASPEPDYHERHQLMEMAEAAPSGGLPFDNDFDEEGKK